MRNINHIIIAGGRDFKPDLRWLSVVVKILRRIGGQLCIVSGNAKGADRFGESIAELCGIPVEIMPADWDKFGKSAGYRRNEAMAEIASHAIILPGGKGTDHMFDIARRRGLHVFDCRCKKEIRIIQYKDSYEIPPESWKQK